MRSAQVETSNTADEQADTGTPTNGQHPEPLHDRGMSFFLQLLLAIVIAAILTGSGLYLYARFVRDATATVGADNLARAVTVMQDIGQKRLSDGSSNYAASVSDKSSYEKLAKQLNSRLTGIEVKRYDQADLTANVPGNFKGMDKGASNGTQRNLPESETFIYVELLQSDLDAGKVASGVGIGEGKMLRMVTQPESDLSFCALLIASGPDSGVYYDSWSGADRDHKLEKSRQAHCAWNVNSNPPPKTDKSIHTTVVNSGWVDYDGTTATEPSLKGTNKLNTDLFFKVLPPADRESVAG